MEETNETVDEVLAESTNRKAVRDYRMGISNGMQRNVMRCAEDVVNHYAMRFRDAHKRELSVKDAEIEKLKLDNMVLKSGLRAADEVFIERDNKDEAKDAEIERLKSIKREYVNMQSNITALRREVSLKQKQNVLQGSQYRDKLAKLRGLVKELADQLECCASLYSDLQMFEGQKELNALVAKVREVANEQY